MEIRETSDSGRPIVVSDPDGAHAKAYQSISRQIWEQIIANQGDSNGPRIVIQ